MFLNICYIFKKIKSWREARMDNNSKEYVSKLLGQSSIHMTKLANEIMGSVIFRGYTPAQIGASIITFVDLNGLANDFSGEDLLQTLSRRYGPAEIFNHKKLLRDLHPILHRLRNKKL
jgi:hypothetical protein